MHPRNGVVLADHSDHLRVKGTKNTDRITFIGHPQQVEKIVQTQAGEIDYSDFGGLVLVVPNDVANTLFIESMRTAMEEKASELVRENASVFVAVWPCEEVIKGYSVVVIGNTVGTETLNYEELKALVEDRPYVIYHSILLELPPQDMSETYAQAVRSVLH